MHTAQRLRCNRALSTMDPDDIYLAERGELMEAAISDAVSSAIQAKAADPLLAVAISLLQQHGGNEAIISQLMASATVTAPVAVEPNPTDGSEALAKVHAHRRFLHGESPAPGLIPARCANGTPGWRAPGLDAEAARARLGARGVKMRNFYQPVGDLLPAPPQPATKFDPSPFVAVALWSGDSERYVTASPVGDTRWSNRHARQTGLSHCVTPYGRRFQTCLSDAPFAVLVARGEAPFAERSFELQRLFEEAPPLHPRASLPSADTRVVELGWQQRLEGSASVPKAERGAVANPLRSISPEELLMRGETPRTARLRLKLILDMSTPDGDVKAPSGDDGNARPFFVRKERILDHRWAASLGSEHELSLFDQELLVRDGPNDPTAKGKHTVAVESLRAWLHEDEDEATAAAAKAAAKAAARRTDMPSASCVPAAAERVLAREAATLERARTTNTNTTSTTAGHSVGLEEPVFAAALGTLREVLPSPLPPCVLPLLEAAGLLLHGDAFAGKLDSASSGAADTAGAEDARWAVVAREVLPSTRAKRETLLQRLRELDLDPSSLPSALMERLDRSYAAGEGEPVAAATVSRDFHPIASQREELDTALPEAAGALDSLDAKAVGELRALKVPPAGISDVMAAVICLLQTEDLPFEKVDTSWAAAQQVMSPPQKFVERLVDVTTRIDGGLVPKSAFANIQGLLKLEHFDVDVLKAKSNAAAGLADFVININVYNDLRVRRRKVDAADALVGLAQWLECVRGRYHALRPAIALDSVGARDVAALSAMEAPPAEQGTEVWRGGGIGAALLLCGGDPAPATGAWAAARGCLTPALIERCRNLDPQGVAPEVVARLEKLLAPAGAASAHEALERRIDALRGAADEKAAEIEQCVVGASDLTEVKSLARPAPAVETMVEALRRMVAADPEAIDASWGASKADLAQADLTGRIRGFDRDNLHAVKRAVATRFTADASVASQGQIAGKIYSWLKALLAYDDLLSEARGLRALGALDAWARAVVAARKRAPRRGAAVDEAVRAAAELRATIDAATRELSATLPAVEEALVALEAVNESDLHAIRSLVQTPPDSPELALVAEAMATLLALPPPPAGECLPQQSALRQLQAFIGGGRGGWRSGKQQRALRDFDIDDGVSAEAAAALAPLLERDELATAQLRRSSYAAALAPMAAWARAVHAHALRMRQLTARRAQRTEALARYAELTRFVALDATSERPPLLPFECGGAEEILLQLTPAPAAAIAADDATPAQLRVLAARRRRWAATGGVMPEPERQDKLAALARRFGGARPPAAFFSLSDGALFIGKPFGATERAADRAAAQAALERSAAKAEARGWVVLPKGGARSWGPPGWRRRRAKPREPRWSSVLVGQPGEWLKHPSGRHAGFLRAHREAAPTPQEGGAVASSAAESAAEAATAATSAVDEVDPERRRLLNRQATRLQAIMRGHMGRLLAAGWAAALASEAEADSMAEAEERAAASTAVGRDDTWTPAKWVASLGLHGSVAAALAPLLADGNGEGEAAYAQLRALGGQGDAGRARLQGALQAAGLEGLLDGLWREAQALSSQKASTGVALASKFVSEASFEMAFGGVELFFKGLEGLIGAPRTSRSGEGGGAPSLLNTMRNDHCAMRDSATPFWTSNGMEDAVSKEEWEFVVAPKRKKEYAERGGDFRSKHSEWCRQALPLPLYEARMARVNDKLQKAGHEPLIKEELVGGRLYTGPMFEKYNAVLRWFSGNAMLQKNCVRLGLGEWRGGGGWHWFNQYTTTIHAINSFILKASKLTRASKVFRGLTRASLPDSFWKPDAANICGGVEYAFMSTSTERAQAVHYSQTGGASATVFEMRQGMVDRGASLRWLSQYPHENEILFAPLMGIEVLGARVDGSVLIVDIALSTNQLSLTLEQVVSKRRKVCVDMLKSMQVELVEEFKQVRWAQPAWLEAAGVSLQGEAERALHRINHLLMTTPVEQFNDDDFLAGTFRGVVGARNAVSRWPDDLAVQLLGPMQQIASAALDKITKADVAQLKALKRPPPALDDVFACARLLLADPDCEYEGFRAPVQVRGKHFGWRNNLTAALSGGAPFERLLRAARLDTPPPQLREAMRYLKLEHFNSDQMRQSSLAARGVLEWCRTYMICQRMLIWVRRKEDDLRAKRQLALAEDAKRQEAMASFSDVAPIANAARRKLKSDALPERGLVATIEGGSVAHVDQQILSLLQLEELSQDERAAVLRNLGKTTAGRML